jgi:hypothetical protein
VKVMALSAQKMSKSTARLATKEGVATDMTLIGENRWDEKAGLRTRCSTLSSYQRAQGTRDKGDRQ